MLPGVLVSTYLEYKKDTDAIASWLASTAKAAGFNTPDLSAPPSKASSGGRLKGKARKQAKKAPSKPAAAAVAKYIIHIQDFTVLAEYILEKAIAVPLTFQSTLDRAIAARAGFGARLAEHGSSVDLKADEKHKNFVDASDDDPSSANDGSLPNRFAGLAVHEPSETFLSAPDIQRPTKPEADPIEYAAEIPPSFEDTIFALMALMNDMNNARSTIKSIWKTVSEGGFDIVPAAVTTNTAIQILRNMMEDVLPLVDHHGLKECITKCYMVNCLLKGYSVEDITNCGDVKDNFNYDTYDIANETYILTFRLIEAFQDVIEPGKIPLYRDGTFGTFDANSDRSKKTGLSKFHDDRALLMPVFTDLITIAMNVPAWPVHDEFVRGMKELTRTGRIPFCMVFAAQVFLDVTYAMGPAIETGWNTYIQHVNFITGDLKLYFDYHENLKINTWAASNDQNIKEMRNGIVWLTKDPLFQIHERLFKRQGVASNKDNAHRIWRMSPVMSGLALYQARFNYREAGMAVADAWGSIQYAGHLYNALQCSGLLIGPWEDMDIVKVLLGPESFFTGGEEPRTLRDQFKKYCLQMGVSAAALSQKSRKERTLASKAGPRGMKVNAPVSTMFKERYGNNSDVVLTAEEVDRIIQISVYEMETDEETGEAVMGQIEDEQRLKEKNKLRHELESGSKRSKPTTNRRLSLGKMMGMLVNVLQAETLEFSFPYMMMHRWCWRLFRAVREACHPQLRQLIGPDYLETESQLPTLTGYILMLACGAEGRVPNLEPLKAAADALNEMSSSGAGRFIIGGPLKRLLGMKVGIEIE